MSRTPDNKRVWSLYLDKEVDDLVSMSARVQDRSKSYIVSEILRDRYIREPEQRKVENEKRKALMRAGL
jgi:predicted transcriptional regulator